MLVRAMPKLKQLIYSDEERFDMLGWTVNINEQEITWNRAETFLDYFIQAYGENQLTERGLQTAVRSAALFEIFQEGCSISDGWVDILSNDSFTPADVEHYLQQAA